MQSLYLKRCFEKFALGLLMVCLFVPSQAQATQTSTLPVTDTPQQDFSNHNPLLVRAGITSALEMGKLGNMSFRDAPGMKAFYESRGYEPIWTKKSFSKKQNKNIEPMLKIFENSWTHGLNPNHYNIDKIRELMSTAKGVQKFQLDLTISDAIIRYGKDISAMRVDPKKIGQRSRYWRQPLRGIDILDYVSNHDSKTTALENMSPRGKLYKKLQKELIQLYKTPKDKGRKTKVKIDKAIIPNTTKDAVLQVRRRMGFEADKNKDGHYYYDDQLAQAVMAFQKSHGLKPDGIVGVQTAKLMNITRQDKINQVLANLERLRWVEQNKPNRYIMVNVPSATLWAVENEKVVMEMPVVVGRPERPTNIFSTKVSGIRYNPTWTVPPTIKKDDYLPKLRQNPYYLSDRGIELKSGNQTIDPGLIDWKAKTWSEVNAMRMVQGPGSKNPLGRVRFLMDNPFNIYLHDTPTKHYFKRANRAQSSGCVRLERPIELADFVLGPNQGWSTEKRDKILKTGKLTEIYAQSPLPVYILYQTVWLGDREQIIYGADIYDHDRTLIKALSAIDGVATPSKDAQTKTANLTKDKK